MITCQWVKKNQMSLTFNYTSTFKLGWVYKCFRVECQFLYFSWKFKFFTPWKVLVKFVTDSQGNLFILSILYAFHHSLNVQIFFRTLYILEAWCIIVNKIIENLQHPSRYVIHIISSRNTNHIQYVARPDMDIYILIPISSVNTHQILSVFVIIWQHQ